MAELYQEVSFTNNLQQITYLLTWYEIINILKKNIMNFTNIYKKHKGLWIALDEKLEKVISYNLNAKKAHDEAIEKGYKNPTLFKVPKHNLPYIGFSTRE